MYPLMSHFRIKHLVALPLCLLALSAFAGTTMQSVEHQLDKKEADAVVTVSAQDGNLRVDSPDHNGITIFKDDTIFVLNTKNKTYSSMDRESLKKMAEQISPALKQMQEQLAQMPPEQRAQIEKMMGKSMPGTGQQKTQEIRKTSRTDKVAGYSCKYAEVVEDGVVQQEFCVVPSASLKGSDDLMAAAQKMQAMMQDMLKALDSPWMQQMMDRQATNYAQLGGIPVLTRRFENGKAVTETTLRSIQSQSLPASTFDIPSGYTKQETMQGGMHKGRS
ncbi:MAG TPA: DUF4412 domain-containing protein [Steroidobacteraceae bacterium]|nr:DUF4412 domain-containing protein [Steroidobacteraceae bacterium]